MQDKKKTKVSIRDLKPKKDAKGGFTHQANQGTKAPNNIRSSGGGHGLNKVVGP